MKIVVRSGDEVEVENKSADIDSGMATSSFTILGLEPTPELFAIFLVYFVQGILGLSRLAVSFYFKDTLHMDPAELAIYTGFGTLPWLIKPVYGFVSDTFPLFGYRRRSYLMLCGFLGALSWGCLCFGTPQAELAAALLVLGSLGTACSDVVVDSIVVQRSRGKTNAVAGSLQSLCWGSAAVGGVVSSYFSGSLIEHYGVQFVFGVTALFPLLVSVSAVLIDEAPVRAGVGPARGLHGRDASSANSPSLALPAAGDNALKSQVSTLWSAIKQPSILYPSIFVFLWQATPGADSALFYFYTNELHFGPEFLGRVRLVGALASLFGIWLYNTKLKTVPMKTMFRWAAVLGTGLGLTQVILVTGLNRTFGVSDEFFSVADEIILTVLGKVSFMPILVLASRICPVGVEATLFATLMSILNSGSVTSSFLGSVLTKVLGVTATDFTNLAPLVTICALSSLLPLPLLSFLPPEVDGDREDDEVTIDKNR